MLNKNDECLLVIRMPQCNFYCMQISSTTIFKLIRYSYMGTIYYSCHSYEYQLVNILFNYSHKLSHQLFPKLCWHYRLKPWLYPAMNAIS